MSLSVSALGQEKVNNQTDQKSKNRWEEEGDIKPVWHCVQTPHTADTGPAFSFSWSRSAGPDSLFAVTRSGYLQNHTLSFFTIMYNAVLKHNTLNTSADI